MHTPELWEVNGIRLESRDQHGVVNDGWIIAEFEGPDAADNCRRTKVCVNAMASVSCPKSLMAAVDEVLSETSQRGNQVTWEMLNAIKRLRAARGTDTDTTKGKTNAI